MISGDIAPVESLSNPNISDNVYWAISQLFWSQLDNSRIYYDNTINTSNRNSIVFFNVDNTGYLLSETVRGALEFAIIRVQQIYNVSNMSLNYYNYNYSSTCSNYSGGGGGTVAPSSELTEQEVNDYITSLSNPVTGDGIELYLVALYTHSKLLNLAAFTQAASNSQIGEYTLTAQYSSNGSIAFYTAFRNGIKGIEYLIRPDQLSAFSEKIAYYTYAADLIYIGGVPSQAQIQVMAGDYIRGLTHMWSSALRSPAYWAYLGTLITVGAPNAAVLAEIEEGLAGPEFTYEPQAGAHLTELVGKGVNKGQLRRPYMDSPLTVQEIMATGPGTVDATYAGGLNWRVPGNFRGSNGVWELGINPQTKVIYHFNFTN